MSREPNPHAARVLLCAAAMAVAGIAGCGGEGGRRERAVTGARDGARDTTHGVPSVGRAGADSVWRAPGAQAGAGAAAAPTPGFTSARGTPPPVAAVADAPAAVAARLAPPPPMVLVQALGADEQAAIARLPAGPGRDLAVGNCLICHAATMLTQQHKDTAGWNKTVTQMVAWGAPLRPADKPALLAYLAAHYPARSAGPPARQAP